MESDNGRRPRIGVLVMLEDLGDGTSRIIMDDMSSDSSGTKWQRDCFYTHKKLNSEQTDKMELPDEEYQGMGVSLMARLLALNGRVK